MKDNRPGGGVDASPRVNRTVVCRVYLCVVPAPRCGHKFDQTFKKNRHGRLGAGESFLVFLRRNHRVRVLHRQPLCGGDVRGVFVLQEHEQFGGAHLAGGEAMARLRETTLSGLPLSF